MGWMAHLTMRQTTHSSVSPHLGIHWLQARLLHVFIRSYFGRESAQRKRWQEKICIHKIRSWHLKLLQVAKNCLAIHAARVGFLNLFQVPAAPYQDTTSTLPLSPFHPVDRPSISQNG